MPLLNNNKKRDVPASPCFVSPGCSTWFICPPVQAFFACFEIDNNIVIVALFDRCPRIERRRTSQHCVKCACSSESFARSSNEKKNHSESHEAKDHLLMSADVVSLVSTDQNWWNQ